MSELKLRESSVSQSEARFRAMIENGLDNISLIDAEGKLLWESPATIRPLGYQPGEHLGKDIFQLVHPEDLESLRELFGEVLNKNGNRRQAVFRLRHKDGTWRWIEGVGTNRLDDPNLRAIVLNYRDISERKETELALRKSEKRLRWLFDTSPDAIVLLDPHDPAIPWKILDCNDIFCLMNGYSREELIGQSIDIVNINETSPDDRTNYLEYLRREGVMQKEAFHRHKDGHLFPIEISSSLTDIEGRELVLGIDRDITGRKKAEKELRDAETRYRTLVERIPAITYILDESPENPRTIYVSPQIEQILGFTAEEWMASDLDIWKNQIFPEDLERVLAEDKASREEGRPFICEYRIRRKDGRIIWLHDETHYTKEPGERHLAQGIEFDITERKLAEKELHRAQEKYQNIFENAQEGIYQTSPSGRYIAANPALARMLGYSSPDELKTRITDLNQNFYVIPNRREEFKRIMDEDGTVTGFESEIYCKDGTTIWLSENAHAVRDDQGRLLYYEGTNEDITARKKAEAALIASEADYRLLFENNPLPMWVYDSGSLRFLAVNEAAIAHYGYSREEFLEMTIEDIRPRGELVKLRANLNEPRKSKEHSGPWVHRKKDGTLIEVDITSNELSLTGRSSRLVLAKDISEQVRAESATKQRLSELEAINRISTALRSASKLEEMMPILLDETLAVMDSTAGTIKLYDATEDALVPIVSRGWYEKIDNILIKPGVGTSGKVFLSGEPYVAREFIKDSTTFPSTISSIPSGWGGACVPIRTAQSVSGVIFIAVPLPRELNQVDVKLLTTLAEIAGNAIHRTRLYEQTEQQLKRLAALRSVDEAIATSFDLKLTLNVLLGHVIQELGVDAACLLLLNPHMQTLEYAASLGFRSRDIEKTKLRLGQGLPGEAAVDHKSVFISDLELESDRFVRSNLLTDEKFKAYYCVPLIIKGQVKGVLELFHRSDLLVKRDWEDYLEAMAGQAAIALDNAELFEGLTRSNIELSVAYDGMIEGWSRALELRGKEVEGHAQRVTELTLRLARSLGISETDLVQIRRGALLHDIGKMGVPDSILFKPDTLTEEEWIIMRKHPGFAHEMLSSVKYLMPALDIPHFHHEKWDGSGYPRGLTGEQIPLAARIFAIVDVWDSLNSDKPYRKAWTSTRAKKHIQSQSGHHFDPNVVEAFLELLGRK